MPDSGLDELILREIELDRRAREAREPRPVDPLEKELELLRKPPEEPKLRRSLQERVEQARVNRDASLERTQLRLQKQEQSSRRRHAANLQFAEECGQSGVQRFRRAWREKEQKVERLLEAQHQARIARVAENAKREVDVKKILRDNRKEMDQRPAHFEQKLAAKFAKAEKCRQVLGQEGRTSRYRYGFLPADGKPPGEREPDTPIFQPADHYNESAERFGPTWQAAMEDEKAANRLREQRAALTYTPSRTPEPRPVSRSSRGISRGSSESLGFDRPASRGSQERPGSRDSVGRPGSRGRSDSPTWPLRSPLTSGWGSESLRTLNPEVVVEVRDRQDPTLRAAEFKMRRTEEDWAHRQVLEAQIRGKLSDAKARRTGIQQAKKQELKKAAKELEAKVKGNLARKRQREEEALEEARLVVAETQERALRMEQQVAMDLSRETKRRVEASAAHVALLRDRKAALRDLMVMTANLRAHVDETRMLANVEQLEAERRQAMHRKESEREWRHRQFHERRDGLGGAALGSANEARQRVEDRVNAARRRRSEAGLRGRYLGPDGRLLPKWRSCPRLAMSETWGPSWDEPPRGRVKSDYADAELEEVLEAELEDYLAQEEQKTRRGSDAGRRDGGS